MFQTYNRCRLKMHDVHADMKKNGHKDWHRRHKEMAKAGKNVYKCGLKQQTEAFEGAIRAVS